MGSGRRDRSYEKAEVEVISTLVDRYDVAVVLKVTLATIRFVDDREKAQLAIHNLNGVFAGEVLDMWQVEQRLTDSLERAISK